MTGMFLQGIRGRAPWIGIFMPIVAFAAYVWAVPYAGGRDIVQLVRPRALNACFTPTAGAVPSQLSDVAVRLRNTAPTHAPSALLNSAAAFDPAMNWEYRSEALPAAASPGERYSRYGRAPPLDR